MGKKVTWDDIYKDFRSRHPNLKKTIMYWHPYDYAMIMLYFKDGRKGVYDFLEQRVQFVSER